MTKFKVNDVFPYKGKLYKVIKSKDCTNCAFFVGGNSCRANAAIFHCVGDAVPNNYHHKYVALNKNTSDMSLNKRYDTHKRIIADMTINVEKGVNCADCAFCNICYTNGVGAKNDFYFNVKDYFGDCASDKCKDGESIVFTISGKNTLYIPFTGGLECGVSGANASHTISASNTTQIIHPLFTDDNKINDIQVVAPGGYLIDVEHSDIEKGIIRFKSIYITYDYIRKSLNIKDGDNNVSDKAKAIDALFDIANYYNGDWKPDWNDDTYKYRIYFNYLDKCFKITNDVSINYGMPIFKNKEDAQLVLDNTNFGYILNNIFGID